MSDSNPSRTQHEFSSAILGAAPRIRSFLRRLSGNSQAVEDMAQDVLERALRYRQAFDPTAGTLDSWLMKTAFHTYLDHRKRSDRQPAALGEAVQSVHGRDVNPAESRDEVAHLLGLLRPMERDIVLRFYRDRETVAEIGRALAMPEGTVKSHLHRARHRLAEMQRREGDG